MWDLTTLISIIVPASVVILLKVLQISLSKDFTEGERTWKVPLYDRLRATIPGAVFNNGTVFHLSSRRVRAQLWSPPGAQWRSWGQIEGIAGVSEGVQGKHIEISLSMQRTHSSPHLCHDIDMSVFLCVIIWQWLNLRLLLKTEFEGMVLVEILVYYT